MLANASVPPTAEFFDQNPISKLGLISTQQGTATKLSELGNNQRRHTERLDASLAKAAPRGGDMSLQTALEMALRTLDLIPPYGTREVLLVHGAHGTADAGDISSTIAALQRARVRVSAISLPGEVFVVTRTTRETGGTCAVPESLEHLRVAMLAHCKPPPRRADELSTDTEGRSRLVEMGFPRLVHSEEGICACHAQLRPRAFICPRCGARMCELPSTCALCRLQLVSAPSLARSYHHLFPIDAFVEVPNATTPGELPLAHSLRPLQRPPPQSSDIGSPSGDMLHAGVTDKDTASAIHGPRSASDARAPGSDTCSRGTHHDAPVASASHGGTEPVAASGIAISAVRQRDRSVPLQVNRVDADVDMLLPQSATTVAPPQHTGPTASPAKAPPHWVSPFNTGAAVTGASAPLHSSRHEGPQSAQGSHTAVDLVHDESTVCGGCGFALAATEARFVCPVCRTAVCGPCEQLIHETLHSCPGCVGRGAGR